MISINDVRKAGYCTSGARRWFALHRLDFAAFLKNGIAEQTLLDTGDEMALDVVAKTRERLTNG